MKDVEGGTRTRRHLNILLHAGLATVGDCGKHEWRAHLLARLVVQAGSQTVWPAGTWVGVSARMYNDSNSLGDRAKEGRRRGCVSQYRSEGFN